MTGGDQASWPIAGLTRISQTSARRSWAAAPATARVPPRPRLSLLRRFLPGVAVGFWFCLEAQVSPFVPVAGAVAEDLFFAGEILGRTMDHTRPVPGRGFHGEIRIHEVWARERDE